MLEQFYEELNNIIALINFEHDIQRDWLLLILDYIHLICLNTVNHWRITSSQINGSLNGLLWNKNILDMPGLANTNSLYRIIQCFGSF